MTQKPLPPIVSAAEWQAAHDSHLAKEKAMTHARDALAAERRRLPIMRIEKSYTFEAVTGAASLAELFEGRDQLALYHFMFAPSVEGWPDAGCVGCSLFFDQIGNLSHLHARGVTFAAVSLAPLANIERYRHRMGWKLPWYSSAKTDFNKDLGLTRDDGEYHGLSLFLRDGSEVYRTYFTSARGLEMLGSAWSILDLTPYGRRENWEESPGGWPQTPPYEWWHRHDEYQKEVAASSCCDH